MSSRAASRTLMFSVVRWRTVILVMRGRPGKQKNDGTLSDFFICSYRFKTMSFHQRDAKPFSRDSSQRKEELEGFFKIFF